MNMQAHRGLWGLAAAAAVGGLTTAVELVVIYLVTTLLAGAPPNPTEIVTSIMLSVWLILMIGLFAAIAFSIGLVIVGLPAWALLLRLGLRTRRVAVLAGAGLTAVTAAGLGLWSGYDGIWFTVFMILPGVAAGWTLHRVAYRKAAPA